MQTKYEVIALTSKKSSDIVFRNKDSQYHWCEYYGQPWFNMGDEFRELYLVTDEEILPGDLRVDMERKHVGTCINQEESDYLNSTDNPFKKVAATTNLYLWTNKVAKLSDEFAKEFVRNKGDMSKVKGFDDEINQLIKSKPVSLVQAKPDEAIDFNAWFDKAIIPLSR